MAVQFLTLGSPDHCYGAKSEHSYASRTLFPSTLNSYQSLESGHCTEIWIIIKYNQHGAGWRSNSLIIIEVSLKRIINASNEKYYATVHNTAEVKYCLTKKFSHSTEHSKFKRNLNDFLLKITKKIEDKVSSCS